MISWRLNWLYSQIFSRSNISTHQKICYSSWKYWLAIILKFIPHLWPFKIKLKLRDGSIVIVEEFMTLYVYNEIFIEGCYDLMISNCLDPTIIDIGANTGLFVLRMKQLYPNARILAYEPLPINYERLNYTIEINKLNKCETFMYGIGGYTRKENLYVHPKNIGGHSIYLASSDQRYNHIEIAIIDIRQELKKLNGKSCQLLKLDCEGAEFEILKRINSKIATKIEKIIFEATPSLYDINELIEHLTNLGYEVTKFKGLYSAVKYN